MLEIINMLGPVLPIIVLVILGKILNYKQYILPATIAEIKKFLLNICLPCTLFNMTLFMHIEANSFLMIGLSYVMLCVFLVGGKLCNFIPFLRNKFNPYICSGTGFMLVGMALYTMIYGTDNLEIYSFIGVGNELFVWTVYLVLFKFETSETHKFDLSTAKNIIKSPLILSMVFGMILNLLGVGDLLNSSEIGLGILKSITTLSGLASPLILVTLGYGLTFKAKYLKESMKLVISRLIVMFGLGFLFKFLVIDFFFEPSLILDLSFIGFFVLPPMFTLTLLVEGVSSEEEVEIVNSAIGISTIISIILLIIISFIIPPESIAALANN